MKRHQICWLDIREYLVWNAGITRMGFSLYSIPNIYFQISTSSIFCTNNKLQITTLMLITTLEIIEFTLPNISLGRKTNLFCYLVIETDVKELIPRFGVWSMWTFVLSLQKRLQTLQDIHVTKFIQPNIDWYLITST